MACAIGGAAAFLLVVPAQVMAADPLSEPVARVSELVEPFAETKDPVAEALEVATDPVVEATRPVTDPVVETTMPVTDEVVGRVEPIIDPLPDLPAAAAAPAAPTAKESPTSGRDQTSHRSPLPDAERAGPVAQPAPRSTADDAPDVSGADYVLDAPASTSVGLTAPSLVAVPATGSGSPLSNASGGLLMAVVTATLIGIATGWRRLSFERLRRPRGLVLAPPVPPG